VSPAIRDGRGKLTVHDMADVALASHPPGPVERVVEPSVVAPKRLNVHDYMAASRARGAKAGGFVKGAKKTSGPPPISGVAPTTHPLVGFKRSPEVRERMRLAQLARHAKARGDTPAPADPAVEPPVNEARNGTGIIPPPDPPRSIEVVLPCADCVHALVCAIKANLELTRWPERLGVGPPAPDPAITVSAISVSCTHYLAVAE
jgi:hypothetical protein